MKAYIVKMKKTLPKYLFDEIVDDEIIWTSITLMKM